MAEGAPTQPGVVSGEPVMERTGSIMKRRALRK
jgi:hypothetical protein